MARPGEVSMYAKGPYHMQPMSRVGEVSMYAKGPYHMQPMARPGEVGMSAKGPYHMQPATSQFVKIYGEDALHSSDPVLKLALRKMERDFKKKEREAEYKRRREKRKAEALERRKNPKKYLEYRNSYAYMKAQEKKKREEWKLRKEKNDREREAKLKRWERERKERREKTMKRIEEQNRKNLEHQKMLYEKSKAYRAKAKAEREEKRAKLKAERDRRRAELKAKQEGMKASQGRKPKLDAYGRPIGRPIGRPMTTRPAAFHDPKVNMAGLSTVAIAEAKRRQFGLPTNATLGQIAEAERKFQEAMRRKQQGMTVTDYMEQKRKRRRKLGLLESATDAECFQMEQEKRLLAAQMAGFNTIYEHQSHVRREKLGLDSTATDAECREMEKKLNGADPLRAIQERRKRFGLENVPDAEIDDNALALQEMMYEKTQLGLSVNANSTEVKIARQKKIAKELGLKENASWQEIERERAAVMKKRLGLPRTATDAQVKARQAALKQAEKKKKEDNRAVQIKELKRKGLLKRNQENVTDADIAGALWRKELGLSASASDRVCLAVDHKKRCEKLGLNPTKVTTRDVAREEAIRAGGSTVAPKDFGKSALDRRRRKVGLGSDATMAELIEHERAHAAFDAAEINNPGKTVGMHQFLGISPEVFQKVKKDRQGGAKNANSRWNKETEKRRDLGLRADATEFEMEQQKMKNTAMLNNYREKARRKALADAFAGSGSVPGHIQREKQDMRRDELNMYASTHIYQREQEAKKEMERRRNPAFNNFVKEKLKGNVQNQKEWIQHQQEAKAARPAGFRDIGATKNPLATEGTKLFNASMAR
eukprot:g1718.t1